MNKSDLLILKKNLPIQPGILCKEEYFNSAVLIPLILRNDEYYLLFEKRADGIRQGGEICFPGGEYDEDADNNYLETATRETLEELGVPEEAISIIGRLDTFIGPMGVTVDPFIGILDINSEADLKIDKNEVEKVIFVPASYFKNNPPEVYKVKMEVKPYYMDKNGDKVDLLPVKELGLPIKYAEPWAGKKHKIFVYRTQGEVIWGITAHLVYDFINRLGK